MRVFIYGAPGVGKTFLGHLLKEKISCEYIEGDYLREITAQKEHTKEESPFFYVGVKEAYRKFGELTPENVIKGLNAVRKSMNPYVLKEIYKNKKLILEAAFIDPSQVKEYGKAFLIIVKDSYQHKKQFLQDRKKSRMVEEGFKSTRIIQNYLVKEAKELNISILDNVSSNYISLLNVILDNLSH